MLNERTESEAAPRVLACPDCDLLQVLPEIPPKAKARCARCGRTLASYHAAPIDRPLALTIAALLVLIVANAAPLMGLSVVGRHADTTIIGGAYAMWIQGQEITALIVAFCAVLAPGGYLVFMLTVLLGARRDPVPRWVGGMLRRAEQMQPWSMTEVMMLGILVALVKIAELAEVEAGIGIYAVGVLMLLFPAIISTFDAEAVWQRVRWAEDGSPSPRPVDQIGQAADPETAP